MPNAYFFAYRMKRSVDTPFLILVWVLVSFGLLIFTSAALGLLARDGASFTSVATTQVFLGLACGSLLLFILSRLDYRKWRPYTAHFFAFAVALTLLTFIPHVGLELKGAQRWVEVGPLSFQPGEILKFAAILFLAAVYATRLREIKTWKGGMLPLALIAGGASLIFALQPDTDAIVMICGASAVMLFAAGGRMTHLLALLVIGVAVIGVLALNRPYLAERFATFLDPSRDLQGAGFQTEQSLIAIGSGGLFGRGFGQSIEKFSYLPEPIGDSIFAVAGEEFGFVGTSFLVLLFAAFAALGLRIAARAPDVFGGLLVTGLVVLIAGQAFFNITSTLGLVPLSGLPLIFVSHGGTALAIALAEVGVILSVSRRMKEA